MDGLSAADIAAINGGENGWGGMIWLFAILALMGGGFGWGGNNQQYATRDQVQNGFDTQNLNAQTRDILTAVNNGTAQTVATANQTFHDSLAAMQSLYNETARDIAALQVGQVNLLANQNQCCSEQKSVLAQMNYDAAMRDAATNANIAAQGQKILDAIMGNKIEEMQNRINQLELQNALAGVVRYPQGYTYNAGNNPFCNCGCGCNM